MGRYTDYTEETADLLCARLSNGESLSKICREEDSPSKTSVFRWLRANEEFRNQYARAREEQAEHFADELIEIADDTSNDVTGELCMPNSVAVQRAKLRVDTRKWIASKLLAKKYGDKLQHTGSDGEGPVQFVVTRSGSKEK